MHNLNHVELRDHPFANRNERMARYTVHLVIAHLCTKQREECAIHHTQQKMYSCLSERSIKNGAELSSPLHILMEI